MDLKIDRLKMLLPGFLIEHFLVVNDISFITINKLLNFSPNSSDVEIVNRVKNTNLYNQLYNFREGFVSKNRVLSEYYSIVNFNPDYKPLLPHSCMTSDETNVFISELTDILNQLIKDQKEKELLLEEVLRSKTNIDGLIENRLRSFIYYNIPFNSFLPLSRT